MNFCRRNTVKKIVIDHLWHRVSDKINIFMLIFWNNNSLNIVNLQVDDDDDDEESHKKETRNIHLHMGVYVIQTSHGE